jgi:hypothetical protein
MEVFPPFKQMIDGGEFDAALLYLKFLQSEKIGFKDFSSMPGRITLFKLAMQRPFQLPAEAFQFNMGANDKANQLLCVFRAEVARSWQARNPEDTGPFIERAGAALEQLVTHLTRSMLERFRADAKRNYVEQVYKSSGAKFPKEILLESTALAKYRDVVLEIDLGL